jgi:hypothetical protein
MMMSIILHTGTCGLPRDALIAAAPRGSGYQQRGGAAKQAAVLNQKSARRKCRSKIFVAAEKGIRPRLMLVACSEARANGTNELQTGAFVSAKTTHAEREKRRDVGQ